MKKLFSLVMFALLSIGSAWADDYKFGLSRELSGTAFADGTEQLVGTDNLPEGVTVSVTTTSNKTGNNRTVVHGSSTTYTVPTATNNRYGSDNTVVNAFTDVFYFGFDIVVPAGKKLSFKTFIGDMYNESSRAGAFQFKVLDNNAGTTLYTSNSQSFSGTSTAGTKTVEVSTITNETTKANLTDITSTTLSVRMEWYQAGSSSYVALKDYQVEVSIEDYVATGWEKPTFTLGEYDGSQYSVTISSVEGTTLKYKVGDNEEYTTTTSNSQIVSVAPGITIKAIATGEGMGDSEEATLIVPAAPKIDKPTTTVGSYNYEKEGYAITITSTMEGATISYKIGSNEYTSVENGSTVYLKSGALTVKASKNGYGDSDEVSVGTLNAAPSSTSPETLIAFSTTTDGIESNKDHAYKSVNIPGTYVAGIHDSGKGLKLRSGNNATSIEGVSKAFSLNVNEGYKVTAVKITAISNYEGAINVPNMYVDGEKVSEFTAFEIPGSKADASFEETFTVNATSEIAWELEPASGATQFRATIEVTYIPTTPETKEVTEYGWATYIPAYAAKFNEGDAYVITDVNDEAVIIENVTEVPANTAVLLKGKGEKTITFIESATPLENENLLKVCEGTEVEGKTAYVLAKDGDSAGFKKWGGEIAALTGRAVLWLGTQAARGFFALDGETTGIKSVATSVEDGTVYDLQGRRVAQPKAGLYIVNGKKVVVK